jgi:predicted amidohydrolase
LRLIHIYSPENLDYLGAPELTVVKIGVVQFSRNDNNPDNNFSKVKDLLSTSSSEIIFLSENWLSREPVGIIRYMDIVGELSAEYRKGVLFAGAQYVKLGNTVRSIGLAGESGEVRLTCEKIFPSAAVGEREWLTPGTYIGPIQAGPVSVGCVACVDIMYPEIPRLHALDGALIIYNPSSMPYDRLKLWHSVGVSRAAENQVFFIGVNTLGTAYADGRPTKGGSFIADPVGSILLNITEEEGLFEATLDISVIDDVRKRRRYIDDVSRTVSEFYSRFRFMLTHR